MILVYTGDGKGKTSACVGQTVRALGQNMVVAFGQFMKRDGQAGEQAMLARLLGELMALARARDCHLVLSGRSAPEWLIDAADLVTSMTEIKHPWRTGVKAAPGIEF